MKNFKRYTVRHRRKREGKTDYRKRLGLLKSSTPRLVVRKSLKNMVAQMVEYKPEGDVIVASAHSKELTKGGWKHGRNNIPSCYLIGRVLGHKGKKKGMSNAILDLGLQASTKGSRLYAVVKGVIDSGVTIPCDNAVLPEEKRIKGEHISTYKKQEGITADIDAFIAKLGK